MRPVLAARGVGVAARAVEPLWHGAILARYNRFAWNGSDKNGSAFVYTRHQNCSGTVLWPSVNALLDYVPRPQACTGPTQRLIEAWRLFA